MEQAGAAQLIMAEHSLGLLPQKEGEEEKEEELVKGVCGGLKGWVVTLGLPKASPQNQTLTSCHVAAAFPS